MSGDVHVRADLVWRLSCDGCDWTVELPAPPNVDGVSEGMLTAAMSAHLESVHGYARAAFRFDCGEDR